MYIASVYSNWRRAIYDEHIRGDIGVLCVYEQACRMQASASTSIHAECNHGRDQGYHDGVVVLFIVDIPLDRLGHLCYTADVSIVPCHSPARHKQGTATA